ncbi:hypothetical protein [Nostoc sp.]|uniref:hypothetical protein n=1 Tax=Nostoc sp. TaxID=1180 RepID=UPI002FF67FA8
MAVREKIDWLRFALRAMSTTGCPVSLLSPSPDLPSQHSITSNPICSLPRHLLKVADTVQALPWEQCDFVR